MFYAVGMPKTSATGKKKTKPKSAVEVYNHKSIVAVIKRQTNQMAMTEEKVIRARKEKAVVRMVVKGKSIERAAELAGLDTMDAHKILRDTVNRWRTEMALSSSELREIMVRQMDSVLALAFHEAFPHPAVDEQGRPMMVKMCTCPLPDDIEDGLCIIADHNQQVMTKPDQAWTKLALDILHRKKELLSLDKLEEAKVDALRRIYQGVGQEELDKL